MIYVVKDEIATPLYVYAKQIRLIDFPNNYNSSYVDMAIKEIYNYLNTKLDKNSQVSIYIQDTKPTQDNVIWIDSVIPTDSSNKYLMKYICGGKEIGVTIHTGEIKCVSSDVFKSTILSGILEELYSDYSEKNKVKIDWLKKYIDENITPMVENYKKSVSDSKTSVEVENKKLLNDNAILENIEKEKVSYDELVSSEIYNFSSEDGIIYTCEELKKVPKRINITINKPCDNNPRLIIGENRIYLYNMYGNIKKNNLMNNKYIYTFVLGGDNNYYLLNKSIYSGKDNRHTTNLNIYFNENEPEICQGLWIKAEIKKDNPTLKVVGEDKSVEGNPNEIILFGKRNEYGICKLTNTGMDSIDKWDITKCEIYDKEGSKTNISVYVGNGTEWNKI